MLRKSFIQHDTNYLNSLKSAQVALKYAAFSGSRLWVVFNSQCAVLDLTFQNLIRFSVRFKILYRIIQRLIRHCLLRKMVYLNIIYVIATRNYEFFYYRHCSVINELLRYSTVTTYVLAK